MIDAIRAFLLAMMMRMGPVPATVQGSHGRPHDGANDERPVLARVERVRERADERKVRPPQVAKGKASLAQGAFHPESEDQLGCRTP